MRYEDEDERGRVIFSMRLIDLLGAVILAGVLTFGLWLLWG